MLLLLNAYDFFLMLLLLHVYEPIFRHSVRVKWICKGTSYICPHMHIHSNVCVCVCVCVCMCVCVRVC